MSQADLNNIIARVTELYHTANALTDENALQSADNIYGLTLSMVRNRRTTPVTLTQNTRAIRNNPLEKTKAIAQNKLQKCCPTECAICQEVPKYKDAVLTECGHYYCKVCWQSWMNAPGSNHSCPTCRKDIPRTTSFIARKTKQLTAPLVSTPFIIED
jgi:hypothetical protein